MTQKSNQKEIPSKAKKRLYGDPISIRPYLDQRERFFEFVVKENKALAIEGDSPKTASEHARWVFEKGLESIGISTEQEVTNV